ncbi:hypothetical protein BGZ70_007945 [Mortierella alpina]|uniref:Thioredoxin domain-containing protein n=1 Tax=Mortierella alpina TaxID=64518 RepID=A0A9P6J6Y6_MORAP|nr:hypothetical protein BGZ70_007945 [Mortierella alpina]
MYIRSSILSAVIAIAACAGGADASAASQALTGKTFDASIADGATFVKFYSSECEHSKKLAPTWEEVAVKHKDLKRTTGFKFAEVNCLTEADLCEDNDVVSYPTMQLFYKGKTVTKYKKRRTIENLTEFVTAYAAEFINVPSNVNAKDVGEVRANALGKVVTLDADSYARRTPFGPWLIEYYAPWCGHCKALAPIYEQLAVALKDKVNVAKIDCTTNEEICQKALIRGYPTIRLHQHGESIEYRKQRSVEAMTEFALAAIVPSVKPITLEQLPEIRHTKDVTFVYVHDAKTQPETTALIERQSQIYYETVDLYESQDPELARELSVSSPSLTVLKDNRQYTYPGSLTDSAAVQEWIKEIRKPLVLSLTNTNVGRFLSQPGWVALGIVDPTKPATVAARRELIETAHKYKSAFPEREVAVDQPLRFAILDATQWESYVRGAFDLEMINLPAVFVVNSREEMFYPHGLDGRRVPLDQESLLAYFADIENGVLTPKSMLSLPQKAFRAVQKRFQVVFRFSSKHPMISMAIGTAFVLAIMRKIGGGAPEEAEKKEENEGKDIKQD